MNGVSDAMHFNPHTREGCDGILPMQVLFQIHFNPHTREGCDVFEGDVARVDDISIHTPVKGVTILSWLCV